MPPKNWGDTPEERKRVRFTTWTPTPKTQPSKISKRVYDKTRTETVQKQWRFLNKPQEDLLVAEQSKALMEAQIPSATYGDANVTIGHTFEGSNIEVAITRNDVMEVMSGHYQGPMSFAPMEKHLQMVCDYVNQTYGDEPPYCVSLPVDIGAYLVKDELLKFSDALKARKVTPRSFMQTKFIFVPIAYESEDGEPADVVLLVISPQHKTVEILDSFGTEHRYEWNPIYIRTLNFLATYLGDSFRAGEWMLRKDAASTHRFDEDDHQVDCHMAVLSNAMALAFGFGLPYGLLDIQWIPMNDNPKQQNLYNEDNNLKLEPNEWWVTMKRKRVASELLHSGFEPWKDGYDEENPFDDYNERIGEREAAGEEEEEDEEEEEEEEEEVLDENGDPVSTYGNKMIYEEKNPFAYQFGNNEYASSKIHPFHPISEFPEIYGQLIAKDQSAKTIIQPNGNVQIIINKPPANPRTVARKQRREDRAALAAIGRRLKGFFPNNAEQVARRMQTEPRYQALGSMMVVNDSVTAQQLSKYFDKTKR